MIGTRQASLARRTFNILPTPGSTWLATFVSSRHVPMRWPPTIALTKPLLAGSGAAPTEAMLPPPSVSLYARPSRCSYGLAGWTPLAPVAGCALHGSPGSCVLYDRLCAAGPMQLQPAGTGHGLPSEWQQLFGDIEVRRACAVQVP